MKKYVCTICGYIYDEAAGIPSAGIAPGTKWENLPDDWVCPLCGASKSEFEEQKEKKEEAVQKKPISDINSDIRELSVGELSALCSNLARGCEKQYLAEEADLFTQLADYFKMNTPFVDESDTKSLLAMIQEDLNKGYTYANTVSQEDRGALRALVWGEKVTRILNSILSRYEKEGDAFLQNTNIFVCEACGFVYIGDTPPEVCPVCKVPSWKFSQIERR